MKEHHNCAIDFCIYMLRLIIKNANISMAFRTFYLYNNHMQYKFTDYFEKEVLRKRPYIKKEWCIQVLENPLRVEKQEGN
jgi:hypothetical protein